MGNFGGNDISLRVGFDIDRFRSELQQTNGLLNSWSKGIQSTLKTAFLGFTALQIGKNVIQSFAEFQHEMQAVRAIINASNSEFDKLRANAINLARALGVSTKEVASLELELGRLGFSSKEILDSSKSIVLLAKATGEDLSSSAQIAGSTLRAFNLNATETGRVTDVMAAAFNKSALRLSDFGEAIKYVAPVAYAAGLSIEQVSAMLGVLADNGIKGSMAGTSLRKIISDLGSGAAPILTQKLAEMAKSGLSGAQAMDEVGRTAYASLLILSKNTDKVNEATQAYKNSSGELQKMADIMTDDLIGDWNKLTGAIDASIQTLGQNKDGGLREFLSYLRYELLATTDEFKRFEKSKLFPDWTASYREVMKAFEEFQKSGHGAQTTWEAVAKVIAVSTQAQVVTIGFLKEKIKQLNEQYESIDITKVNELNRNRQLVASYQAQIDALTKVAEFKSKANLDFEKGIVPNVTNAMISSRPDYGVSQKGEPVSATDYLDDLAKRGPELYGKIQADMGNHVQVMRGYYQQSGIDVAQFANTTIDILGAMGDSLGDRNKDFGKAFKMIMGNFIADIGKRLIILGLGAQAFQRLIKNFENPYAAAAAVAVGAALVVYGHSVSAAAAGGINGGGGSSATRLADQRGSNFGIQSTGGALQVEVTGTVKADGNHLLIAVQNAHQSNLIRKGG